MRYWLPVVIAVGIYLFSHLLFPADAVALTFDVEMVDTPEMVRSVLLVLERHQARGTFFIEGEFASAHPELVVEISRKHEIGCHSMTHPRLTRVSDEQLADETRTCKALLEEITGRDIKGFRAPYNAADARVLAAVADAGYSYDASAFFWHPSRGTTVLRNAFIGFLPAEDYVLVYLNPLPRAGWWILSHATGETAILVFPPRFVADETGFENLLGSYARKDTAFVPVSTFYRNQ